MDCRTTSTHKFRKRIGFKQYDVFLTTEQLVLTKMEKSSKEENMQNQYVVGYRNDLHFHDYKLAIEIHENGHSDRNIDYEIKRQKSKEQTLGCKLIRIDPAKENFDVFKAINEIFRHIKQSSIQLTKKILIYTISTRLLGLEFKLDNTIKSKAIKYILKINCAIMSKVF